MMRLSLLLLLCAALGTTRAQACDQARITSCLLEHLDTDNSGTIDVAEINEYVMEQPCGPNSDRFCGEDIINHCDVNKNGVIDAGDYDEVSGCVRVAGYRAAICKFCAKCDAL